MKQKDAAAKEKKAVYVKNAEDYLQSEDDYRARNGQYYNPAQYEAVSQRIGYNREEMQASPAVEAAPSARDFVNEGSAIRETLRAGGGGAGEVLGRADKMRRMGTEVLFKSIEKDFSPKAPAPAPPPAASGGRIQAGTPGWGGPSVDGPPVASGVAELLRKPSGGAGSATAKRYALAGREALDFGDAKGALAAAEEAVRQSPGDPDAWALKAAALNRLGRWGEAEEAAQRAVDLDPNNTKALKDLVWAQLHQKKAAEAGKNATRLVLLDGENAESYLLRAFAREMQGNRAGLLSDLERAARLDARFANHFARAKAGLRLFDPDAAGNESLLNSLPPPPAAPFRAGPVVLWLAAAGAAALLAKRGPAWAAAARPRLQALYARATEPPAEARAPAASTAAPELLGGHYRLERVAGRGGMGQVWEAFDTTLERTVAIKEVAPALAKDPAIRGLYLKEARALAALQHPNIVEIFEVLEAPAGLYIVCEWVDGKTLAHILAERRRFSLRTARSAAWPVLDALEFAHAKGFVHRDLKPANVMADAMGRIKLMDFGIARAIGADDGPAPAAASAAPGALGAARTRTLAGTPAYRPPEALRGLVSPRFDVYSLGVMLYEFTTGRLPFGPEGRAPGAPDPSPPSAFDEKLPPEFDALALRMMSGDPLKRPASAAEVKKALAALP